MLIYHSNLLCSEKSTRRKEKLKMKKGIHPNYKKVKVVCTSCGAEFESGSVLDEVRVDTCSNCHPFYTGKQRFASADGRVEKFNKKYGLK
jgi:large subunit ribosomal protein L31